MTPRNSWFDAYLLTILMMVVVVVVVEGESESRKDNRQADR
jgi:hypothetical protein